MIPRLGDALLGMALFAGCGASQSPAQSPALLPSPLGGPCAHASECQAGLFCEMSDPGGQCLANCASSADCGAGALCSNDKRCHRACRSTADCERPGYE